TNGCDPPGLLVDWIEPGALNDAVCEIDPDDTEFKEAGHIFGQRTIVVAVAPFEVNGNRCIDRAYDARNDLLDECDRNGFAVPVTLRFRNPSRRKLLQSDPLVSEQPALPADAAAISGKTSISADDPVARNHNGNWVSAIGRANRTDGFRAAQLSRQRPITQHCAGFDR